jgi:broad specificity phosphatase PhoE
MSEILFIRHAETDMAGTYCGQSDPELNARGNTQLLELNERLRGEDIGVVYTSDLRRAIETGISIAETFGVTRHERPALREINFGQWEGLTWKEIEQRDPDYAQRWITEYPRLSAPNGEDLRDFEQRVKNELEFLTMKAMVSSRRIAVVTHAGVLRAVLSQQGYSVADAWQQTGSYCSMIRYTCEIPSQTQQVEVHS